MIASSPEIAHSPLPFTPFPAHYFVAGEASEQMLSGDGFEHNIVDAVHCYELAAEVSEKRTAEKKRFKPGANLTVCFRSALCSSWETSLCCYFVHGAGQCLDCEFFFFLVAMSLEIGAFLSR